MQLIPIEKVFSNRDSVCKAREAFLISKGRTLLPHGLNIREEKKKSFYVVSVFALIIITYNFAVIFKLQRSRKGDDLYRS